jgi:hypothetical protein
VKQFSEMQRMMKRMGGMGSKKVSKARKGKKRKGPGGGRVTARGGAALPMPDLAAEIEATLGAQAGGQKKGPADDLTLPGLP